MKEESKRKIEFEITAFSRLYAAAIGGMCANPAYDEASAKYMASEAFAVASEAWEHLAERLDNEKEFQKEIDDETPDETSPQ